MPAGFKSARPMLLSRRLYPQAPSHRLGALADHFALPRSGRAHRALADAEVTAELLARMRHDLIERHGVAEPDHAFLRALQACSRAQLPRFFSQEQARAVPA